MEAEDKCVTITAIDGYMTIIRLLARYQSLPSCTLSAEN